jgi:dTDP-4-dehydrorhamnose reductase
MKVLICGKSGQLGSDCVQTLGQIFEVIAPDEKEFDITNKEAVESVTLRVSPDAIVNCAAYTMVDACETERELAWNVNVKGPENLARAADKCGAGIIHISSDYVFDGKKRPPEPYTEGDETGPISYYGITKLESELAVRKMTDKHVIIRTAWVYGINGRNFLKTMLRLSVNNPEKELKVVNDQYGSPTWSYRLAQQIGRLIEVNAMGTYHASSEGYCTWYELAKYFLGKMDVKHNLIPCSTDEYPTPAVRPKNSILENSRLKKEKINLMQDWRKEVDTFVIKFKERLLKEAKGRTHPSIPD